jgi:hypothetical protein
MQKDGVNKEVTKGVKANRISKEAIQVLRLLASGEYTIHQAILHLKKSPKNIYKHINNLHKSGLYNKQRQAITPEGVKYLEGYRINPKRFRSHGYEVYYLLPDTNYKESWKEHRGKILKTSKIEFKEKLLKSHGSTITDRSLKFYFHGIECCAYSNGVYAWMPTEISSTPSEAAKKQIDRVIEFGNYLSKLFKIDFFKDNRLNVQMRRSEIAHLDDSIAKELREEEKKLYVMVDNELRIVCDFSHNISEFEAVSLAYGLTDMQCMENYKDDIVKRGGDLQAFTKDLAGNGNQEEYIGDIITHKSEEMRGFESGVFLPSEVVKMFAEQARQNAQLSGMISKQAENIVHFGDEVRIYGQEINAHLRMIDTIREQSQATTNLVHQLTKVVGNISGIKLRQQKAVQKRISDF